jgi:hypothetical protein
VGAQGGCTPCASPGPGLDMRRRRRPRTGSDGSPIRSTPPQDRRLVDGLFHASWKLLRLSSIDILIFETHINISITYTTRGELHFFLLFKTIYPIHISLISASSLLRRARGRCGDGVGLSDGLSSRSLSPSHRLPHHMRRRTCKEKEEEAVRGSPCVGSIGTDDVAAAVD